MANLLTLYFQYHLRNAFLHIEYLCNFLLDQDRYNTFVLHTKDFYNFTVA